jgi:mannose-6-phosphate isomerase class I
LSGVDSAYEKYPVLQITSDSADCAQGWPEVLATLGATVRQHERCVVAVECYPGVDISELRAAFEGALRPVLSLAAQAALHDAEVLEERLRPYLGDDPVFGFMCPWGLDDFFSPAQRAELAQRIAPIRRGIILVLGTGAGLVVPDPDVLVYADVTRWEIQQRQRSHLIGNLGADNAGASASELYKRAYFVDWRAADRQRSVVFERLDFYLDTNIPGSPRLITGALYRRALEHIARRPFRLVPFFDPGPWGGEWMRRRFDLPEEAPNFAWCFDCVPEENSLRLGFGSRWLQTPALPLVHQQPEALLGHHVFRTFGAEFPIRFDFLDTMEGGNLSLQVHPLRAYMAEHFGLAYTQDESYYMLDCKPGAIVYLGLQNHTNAHAFERDLRTAYERGPDFPVERHVNEWPTRKHDHFSIPAGTVHCSGKDNVVLEISATPYIFTFKLWDWERLDLDGRPRPIHLEHGLANIQWERKTGWVTENLIAAPRQLDHRPGVRQEVTGLHRSEFIETRRHWFTAPVDHDTKGTVNVLNLVEGHAVVVDSPEDAFAPLHVHYAETFVVPAAVGRYRVRPVDRAPPVPLATIKAFVRESGDDGTTGP